MTKFVGYDSDEGFRIIDADDEQSADMMMSQDSVVLGKLNKAMKRSLADLLSKMNA